MSWRVLYAQQCNTLTRTFVFPYIYVYINILLQIVHWRGEKVLLQVLEMVCAPSVDVKNESSFVH